MILRRYRLHNSSFIKTSAAAWETDINWGRTTINEASGTQRPSSAAGAQAGAVQRQVPPLLRRPSLPRVHDSQGQMVQSGFPLYLPQPPSPTFTRETVRPRAPPGWRFLRTSHSGAHAGRASEDSPGSALRGAAPLSAWQSGCGEAALGWRTDCGAAAAGDVLNASARRPHAQRQSRAWYPRARSGQTPPTHVRVPKMRAVSISQARVPASHAL